MSITQKAKTNRGEISRTDYKPLSAILIFGLIVRAMLILHPGHFQDLQLFEGWAAKGASFGMGNIYDPSLPGILPDYPPLLLYIYAAIGRVVYAIQGDFHHGSIFVAALKAPAILADCLVAIALFKFGKQVATQRRGTAAAGLFFLLPASWLDSAVWGQMDSIYCLLLLVAFMAVANRRPLSAGIATALALSAKFQAIAFLPFLAILALTTDWKFVWRSFLAFVLTVSIVVIPFLVTGKVASIFSAYGSAVGAYSVLSVDAFNIWRIAFGAAARSTSDLGRLGVLSYRQWGLVAYAVAIILTLAIALVQLRSLDESARSSYSLRLGAVATIVFFLFPTEIHERYLYPFIMFAAIWATTRVSTKIIYCALSIAIALNIAFALSISLTDLFYATLVNADRIIATAQLLLGIGAVFVMLREPIAPLAYHDAVHRRELLESNAKT